jgi:Flp pilus assembly protein TadB
MVSTDEILRKYGTKIEGEMRSSPGASVEKFSKSYESFKASLSPELSRYEKLCKSFGNIFSVKVGEKDRVKIQRNIDISHLSITPSEVVVFSLSVLFLTLFFGLFSFIAIYFITGTLSIMLLFLVFILAIFLFYYSYRATDRKAMEWRLKASSQMVPAVLYIVIYMKHTSNFEKAVAFAAEHLEPPLSLDFRKIFWDVEVGKFAKVKDSVDNYLETWRDYSVEFIEAFHLIESSLYEPGEDRRIQTLEKSLQVILDGVYEKMLKYTHDVKSPLTNLYMLGIVLPTLSLAILPLASTMLGGAVKWYHVFLIFNIIIPFFVLYLTEGIMMARPGGYGDTSFLEKNPMYPKYKSRKPYLIAGLIMLPFLIIGLFPFFWTYTDLPVWLNMQRDYTWNEAFGFDFLGNTGIFGIMTQGDDGKAVFGGIGPVVAGPNGVISLLLSLLVPISIGFFFAIAYDLKSKELIKERKKYKEVEKEFVSSLFQLGNRIADGSPAEIAFAKVLSSTKGTETEGFFKMVNENIQQLGMSLNEALFNPKRGAVIFYPSHLIATSMKILVESVKKGLQVAARSLMSISEYIKNIDKIEARLNDLLADIISDMKSNMTFLAPLLSGIIIGLAGMITTILSYLSSVFNSGGLGSDEGISGVLGAGGLSTITGIFDVSKMIPTYWLQLVVGIYLVEIVFILSSTLVTIKSGKDDLQRTFETGRNLRTTILLYFFIAIVAILGLSLLAAVALSGLGT